MKKLINDRQLALLKGIAAGRARRSGGYIVVGSERFGKERFGFATLQRLLDEGLIAFDIRGWKIVEAGRAYLNEVSGENA